MPTINHWKPLKIGVAYYAQFSADESRLVTIGRSVSLWNLDERRRLFRTHPVANPMHACFSPSGEFVAVKSTSGRIAVVDSNFGEVIHDYRNAREGEGANVCVSPCEKFLIDGSWSGQLTVRAIDTGKVEFRRDAPGTMIISVTAISGTKLWAVHRARVSPHADGPPDYFEFWKWPFKTGPESNWEADTRRVYGSCVSPSGMSIAIIDGVPPARLRLLSRKSGKVKSRIQGAFGSGVGAGLAWAGDGKTIYATEKDKVTALA